MYRKNTIQVVASTISEIITNAGNLIEKISSILNSAFSGTINTIQNQLVPKLKEILDELATSLKSIGEKLADVVFAYIAKGSEVIEIIQPQLNAIAATLSEISEEIQRFLVKTVESIKTAIVEEIKHIKDEIKASALLAKLKAHYEAVSSKQPLCIFETNSKSLTVTKRRIAVQGNHH